MHFGSRTVTGGLGPSELETVLNVDAQIGKRLGSKQTVPRSAALVSLPENELRMAVNLATRDPDVLVLREYSNKVGRLCCHS